METAVRTQHLTKVYSGRVIAVNDMNLQVPRGSIYGLLGPNGAGKTTTLRLLLGLQKTTAGSAEIFGRSCGSNSVDVRRSIGYLPTNPKLPGNLRPVEYLDLLGQLCRLPPEIRKPRLTSLLRAVGLLGATDQRIKTFSTGMNTRLGIAASLIADPPLLLWDEPTAGLDPSARRFTLDLIREMGKNRTVVVATHILGDIDQICDHVGVMHEGRMIFSGKMSEMKQRLQCDGVSLELEGDEDSLQRLAEQVSELDGVDVCTRSGNTLLVQTTSVRGRAAVLADVLKLVDSSGLALATIHSGQNETENAYLQLLQEDKAHGFNRFEFNNENEADADGGHVSP